jgi:hypothetical protein
MKGKIVVLLLLVVTVSSGPAPLPRLEPKNEPEAIPIQVWDSQMSGCSWYCGAPLIRVSATSFLEESNELEHPPRQAHDTLIGTVWSEGAPGIGAGETISFEFVTTEKDTADLFVTSCSIAAGHQGSKELFRKNARPKTLQLLVDGRPSAIMILKDSMGLQDFDLPKLSLERPSNHKIEFKIIDVYPGTEFQDTCITEIRFGGTGLTYCPDMPKEPSASGDRGDVLFLKLRGTTPVERSNNAQDRKDH